MDIVIPGKIPSKKNSKRISCRGKFPLVLPSKAFEEWEHDARILIASERNKLSAADRNHIPLRVPCEVEITFFAHDARLFDHTNKAESVMDLLVDAGIIEDDNCDTAWCISLTYCGIDRANPRAEVKITY